MTSKSLEADLAAAHRALLGGAEAATEATDG